MSAQIRYGPKHDNFLPVDYRNVEPAGRCSSRGPTVLLANRASASAADFLRPRDAGAPHVTVVGDVTEGAFSAQFPEKLPNGWTLWVAFKVVRDHNGVCWDGSACRPTYASSTRQPTQLPGGPGAGVRRAVPGERRSRAAGRAGRPDELKTSLVEAYNARRHRQGPRGRDRRAGARSESTGRDATSSAPTRRCSRRSNTGTQAVRRAIASCGVPRERPELAATYAMLAQAHLGRNEVEAAEAILKQGETVEPMFPWEQPQIARRRRRCARRSWVPPPICSRKPWPLAASRPRSMLEDLLKRARAGGVDESDFNALGYNCCRRISSSQRSTSRKERGALSAMERLDSLGEAATSGSEGAGRSRLSQVARADPEQNAQRCWHSWRKNSSERHGAAGPSDTAVSPGSTAALTAGGAGAAR